MGMHIVIQRCRVAYGVIDEDLLVISNGSCTRYTQAHTYYVPLA